MNSISLVNNSLEVNMLLYKPKKIFPSFFFFRMKHLKINQIIALDNQ